MGTAAKWMLCFRRLTKPAFGICCRFMRQLYYAVAVPRFTYAANIWYAPVTHAVPDARASGSVGATKRLESIQHMAVTAITGTLRTMAMDIMEAHANVLPVELLMHRVCHRAAVRLASLPDTHPLHKPVLACACRQEKCHLSPIHLLLQAYKIKPAEFKAFSLANRPPNIKCVLTTDIAATRDSSKVADLEDDAALKVYTDGSGQDGMASATAVLYKGDAVTKTLKYQLGSLEWHTTYEVELVGLLLGLWLIRQEPEAGSASIKADSQAAILALCAHRTGLGSYLLDKIRELSASLRAQSLMDLQIKISWVSGHDGVARNERADIEAKAAAAGSSSDKPELPPLLHSPLPISVTTARQHFRATLTVDWRNHWRKSPHFWHASKIDPRLPDASFLRLTKEISKTQASTIVQLRSEHTLLRKYLFRIGKLDSPVCALCHHGAESVHHFLFEYPMHQHARFDLSHALGRQSKSL